MEFKDVVYKRKSIRGYKKDPVSKETLTKVLNVATRAVSGKNFQPWEFTVVTGEPIEKLRKINAERFRNREELDIPDVMLSGVYKERAKEIGIGLFKAMEIGREDKEKRLEWGERGYRFFDAPAVILIYMDESVDDRIFRLDIGAVVQNICLAAVDEGLSTCVEYQAVGYNKDYYELLNIPENKRFIVGISIGYEDESYPANSYTTPREDVDTLTNWVGF